MPSSAGRMIQIDADNVSPTRIVGRDEDGAPIEEAIPTLGKLEKFVDRDGNICDVALRTSRMLGLTSEDEKYENVIRRDQITAGSLPLGECPYTEEYGKLVNPSRSESVQDSLIRKPEGAKACRGKPDGCEHLQPVIAKRRQKARAKRDADELRGAAMSQAAAANLARQFSQSMGQLAAIAAAPAGDAPTEAAARAKNLRANMSAGKGE